MLLFKILSWVTLASASSVSQFDLTHELIAKVSERLAEGSQLRWILYFLPCVHLDPSVAKYYFIYISVGSSAHVLKPF